jgi:phage gpG-like protein
MTMPVRLPKIELSDSFFRQLTVLETKIDLLEFKLSDFKEPLEVALHDVVIPSVAANFEHGGRPKWAPLAPGTVRNRNNHTGPILYRSGKLYDAATDPSSWTVTKDMLALTSISGRVKYAGFHQMGAPRANIPARPYVEYQPQDIDAIMELFGLWVDDIIDTVWGTGEEGPS